MTDSAGRFDPQVLNAVVEDLAKSFQKDSAATPVAATQVAYGGYA